MFNWFKKDKKFFITFYLDKYFNQISEMEEERQGWSANIIGNFIASRNNFVVLITDEAFNSAFAYSFCSYDGFKLEIHKIESKFKGFRNFLLENLLSRSKEIYFNVHEKETSFLCELRDKYKFKSIELIKEYFNDLEGNYDAVRMRLIQTEDERKTYCQTTSEVPLEYQA